MAVSMSLARPLNGCLSKHYSSRQLSLKRSHYICKGTSDVVAILFLPGFLLWYERLTRSSRFLKNEGTLAKVDDGR